MALLKFITVVDGVVYKIKLVKNEKAIQSFKKSKKFLGFTYKNLKFFILRNKKRDYQ